MLGAGLVQTDVPGVGVERCKVGEPWPQPPPAPRSVSCQSHPPAAGPSGPRPRASALGLTRRPPGSPTQFNKATWSQQEPTGFLGHQRGELRQKQCSIKK